MRSSSLLALTVLTSILASASCGGSATPSLEDARFGPAPEFETGTQTLHEPFVGVRILARETETPRPLRYWVVFIDPKAPGVDFLVTPENGDAPRETDNQTTRAFVQSVGAQLGINAQFFSPWPSVDAHSDVLGLAISDGVRYSEPEGTFLQAFVVTSDGDASIVDLADETDETDWSAVEDAVGATERIVRAGENKANWEELHPRTAVGVTAEGHVLFFVADGRQDGVSEGMSTSEVAEVLISLGAREAINMDGGGSTTLVVAEPEPAVWNRPVGYVFPGTERANGNNIALFATPR